MPRLTKPLDTEQGDGTAIRTQVILDAATLRALDKFANAHPDIQSRSAAIRKLARDWLFGATS